MRRFVHISLLTILALVFTHGLCIAQTKRTIHVATAGTLSNYFTEEEINQIEELTLTGEINGLDLGLLRHMAGCSRYGRGGDDGFEDMVFEKTNGKLSVLDISGVKIVSGGTYMESYDIDSHWAPFLQDNDIIPSYVFSGCSSLTSITLPTSLTTIASDAFEGCSSLTSITIPKGVSTIVDNPFTDCNSLSKIIVEDGNLKYDSRDNCNAIIESETNQLIVGCMNTHIPNSVSSIRGGAFNRCNFLTSIIIPNNVIFIEANAFSSCNNLTSIKVDADNPEYDSRDNCNAIIKKSSNTLIIGCKNTIIPNSVTSIGDYAFYYCCGLTSITIPNSVTSIGNSSFGFCSSLSSITIPNSVTTISEYAFVSCVALSSIVSEINNPFEIPWNVFYYYFYKSLYETTTINYKDIYGTATLTVPAGTKSLYQSTDGWKNFKNIVEASGGSSEVVRKFESGGITYNVNDNGTTVTVTAGSTKYKGSISIPSSVSYNGKTYDVTSIGYAAFGDCSGLTSISIPNSVMYIQYGAFQNCSGLSSITLPKSIKSIVQYAFIGCSSLTKILSEIESPFSLEGSTFDNSTFSNATLTVPVGTKSLYQSTGGWKNFKNIVEAGSSEVQTKRTIHVATAGTLSSYISESEKYQIEELTLTGEINGDDLGFLRDMAGRSIHGEGDYGPNAGSVFRETGGRLTSLDLSGVRIIAGGCYMITEGADSYWFGELREDDQIPSYIFLGCSVLKSISLPNSLTSIGDNAFEGCSGLTSIVSGIEKPFAITANVFDDAVYSAATLTVPAGTKAKYQATDGWKNFKNIVEAGGEDEPEFTVEGITYRRNVSTRNAMVKSADTSRNYLEIPESVSYGGTSYQVTGIDDNAFRGCNLAALVWDAEAMLPDNAFNGATLSSNFLLYVKSVGYAPPSIENVVTNGYISSLTLSDEGAQFYCPRAFTAENISYTHNYNMETGGDGKGWETIALPFNVQTIKHRINGEIVPFASYNQNSNKKPFWLYSFSGSGFVRASSIQANTPYIIAMPNQSSYSSSYVLAGDVTFSAENVDIPATPSFSGKFVPAYSTVKKASNVYAINAVNRYVSETGGYDAGSRFISNLRDVRPFEAYMSESSTRGIIEIGFGDGTTGMNGILGFADSDREIDIYTLNGQKVMQTKQSELDNVMNQLPHGVYIVNGKKIVR